MNNARFIKKAETELKWAFFDAESDLGLHSNYMTIVNQIIFGKLSRKVPTAPNGFEYPGYEDNSYDNFQKLKFIEKCILALPQKQAKIIINTYNKTYKEHVYLAFDKYTAAAHFCDLKTEKELINLCYTAVKSTQDLAYMKVILTKAKTLYNDAHIAFLEKYEENE